jgi:hydroxymethylpyrimidine kinase/phosphomethylpyrimidine kinase
MGNHNNHSNPTPPILLTIAGFDPSCGAGTAADLKTFAAHGCYGVAAITSLTVQNTQGVQEVQNTPSATLRAQLDILVSDCDIAGVKIGMLGNRGNAVAVAEFLDANKFAHVVHDPVMKSSTGTELLDAAGIKFIATELLRRSSVITPNVPEAEILTGLTIKDTGDMEAAARKIVEMGAHAVIVKGGHMAIRSCRSPETKVRKNSCTVPAALSPVRSLLTCAQVVHYSRPPR